MPAAERLNRALAETLHRQLYDETIEFFRTVGRSSRVETTMRLRALSEVMEQLSTEELFALTTQVCNPQKPDCAVQ